MSESEYAKAGPMFTWIAGRIGLAVPYKNGMLGSVFGSLGTEKNQSLCKILGKQEVVQTLEDVEDSAFPFGFAFRCVPKIGDILRYYCWRGLYRRGTPIRKYRLVCAVFQDGVLLHDLACAEGEERDPSPEELQAEIRYFLGEKRDGHAYYDTVTFFHDFGD